MFRSELQSALTAMGLSITEDQLRQFDVFQEALIETNKVMNLTAITEPKEVAIKHMADSLSCYEEDCFTAGGVRPRFGGPAPAFPACRSSSIVPI